MATAKEGEVPMDIWLRKIHDRKAITLARVPPPLIIGARDADRK